MLGVECSMFAFCGAHRCMTECFRRLGYKASVREHFFGKSALGVRALRLRENILPRPIDSPQTSCKLTDPSSWARAISEGTAMKLSADFSRRLSLREVLLWFCSPPRRA
jgi:hypothetical protein